jgi:hypothetical protein
MKNNIYILILLIQLCFYGLIGAQKRVNDSIPCEVYGVLYDIVFKNQVQYLPDSLGGKSINGRIAVKVFFDEKNRRQKFAIMSIKLYKQGALIENYYKYLEEPLKKERCDTVVAKYYDFVDDYLTNDVFFKKNVLPEYCSTPAIITYLLPIGVKKTY